MAGKSVLVVGGGGREHALCMKLSQSKNIANIHCCPGNAGTAIIATNHSVQASDVNGIVDLSLELGVVQKLNLVGRSLLPGSPSIVACIAAPSSNP